MSGDPISGYTLPGAQLKITAEAVVSLLNGVFPQTASMYTLLDLRPGGATTLFHVTDDHLRPGGTVSGPTLFTVADLTFYIATLGLIGPEPQTVTTQTSINFMRRPSPGPIRGEARVLKLGRSLSVGDVELYSHDTDTLVAHATLTYAIPPRR